MGQDSSGSNTTQPLPGIFTEPRVTPPPSGIGDLSGLEYSLSKEVLIFGILIILMEMFMIWKMNIKNDAAVKFILISLLVTSTLFLVTAGYNNSQIAPAIGLFGTVVGYLLGKANDKSHE